MAQANKGNLNIIGIETSENEKADDTSGKETKSNVSDLLSDDDESKLSDNGQYKEWRFEHIEAALIYHFFRKKDLKIMAEKYTCLIQKDPQDGQAKTLLIKYKASCTEEVEKHIVKMRQKIEEMEKRECSLKGENLKAVVDFLRKPEREEDPVCYIPDIVRSSVEIVGTTYEEVKNADHTLKLAVGEMKPTGSRQGRRTYDTGTERDSAGNKTSKKSYADAAKISRADSLTETLGSNKSFNKNFSRSYSSSEYSGSRSSSASGDDFSFQATLNNGFVLKVYKESITKLEVDVIVNAANENMMHGGGVARVISEAAGWKLDNESAEHVRCHGNLNVAENILTTAGKLTQYKGVIHAVGPVWYQYRNKVECLDDLGECVYNILETCQKKDFRTVAMSAISAGIFAVPKELCADMYVDAAARFSKTKKPEDSPLELHIIDIDTSILKLVEVSFKKWKNDPQSINARVTLPKFLEDNPHQAGQTSSNAYGRHRGHRSQGHGGGGQNFSTGQTSTDVNSTPDKHGLKKTLKRKKEEVFRWGGRAKVYEMDEKLTVKIFKGDIDKAQNMDAVVCSLDKGFTATGFIASALRKTGGTDYTKAFENMEKKCRSFAQKGSVFKCKAGKLGVHHVMHVVMDKLLNADAKETEIYKGSVYMILNKADEWNFPKLVIPLIGTGNIQTNKDRIRACCIAVLKGIDDYLRDSQDKGKVTDIHLVNNNDLVNQTMVEVFDEAINSTPDGRRNEDSEGSGCRQQHGNRSGEGYSGRRSNERRDDRKSQNSSRRDWEKFEDDSADDRPGKHGQGNKGLGSSKKGTRSATGTEKLGMSHPSGQGAEGGALVSGTTELVDDKYKSDSQPVAKTNEEKAKGNLMILEN